MTGPIQSEFWYRVAALKPMVRSTVEIAHHQYRGSSWFILRDPGSGQYHRTNRIGYALIKRLDGRFTLNTIYEQLQSELGEDAPGQNEIIQALEQLAQGGLIQTETPGDLRVLLFRANQKQRQLLRASINPLSFRVALFNPARLLESLRPLEQWLFTKTVLLALVCLVTLSMATALSHTQELGAHLGELTASGHFLVMMWLTYPLLKGLHEIGHGLAVKRFGGDVSEMGVRMLVLMPVPFVDASAATLFDRKSHRALVSAAGILTELAVAALAVLLWSLVNPGVFKDILLSIAIIGSVSTLLFNGNPLMKFDGYYLLADWLEIPNLADRSRRLFTHEIKQRLVRLKNIQRPHTAPGETPWLLGYAVLSWCYRIVIMAMIATLVANYSLPLAGLLLIVFCWLLILRPVMLALEFLLTAQAMNGRRFPAMATAAVMLVVFSLLVFTPAPSSTIAGGIVWLPEAAQIRAGVAGKIDNVLAIDGATVQNGQAVFKLANPEKLLAHKTLREELSALKTEHVSELAAATHKATLLGDQIRQKQKELEVAALEVHKLSLASNKTGVLAIPNQEDLTGAWINAGDTVAYVLGAADTMVRAVLSDRQMQRVKNNTRSVVLRFADEPDRDYVGELVHMTSGGSQQLPSPALSRQFGGSIHTQPDDPQTALDPVFVVDIRVSARPVVRAGQRAELRCRHASESIAVQLADAIRSLVFRQYAS